MQSLIEDLLTYSRVTTRAKPFVATDLNQVLEEVIGDLEARLAICGGRVDAGHLPQLEVDPTQVRQLFQNLIGNALKFRREGVAPVVTLSAEMVEVEGEEWCRLVIADNGIGFDNQYAERIFGVFERLHGREQFEGTGMGLAIVRRLVQRHGGTVTANGVLGEGATFTVMLPAHHPEQAAQDDPAQGSAVS
jgi:light-regulated signal transduction histidine kinase (bacteriophytochrome)